MVFHILYYIEDHGQVDKPKDDGKPLMLRIVWFSIFLNYIEKHGQNDKVEQNIKEKDKDESEEFEEGKLLMLRIVWFSIFMFTHTVRIDIIMSSFLLQKSPQHLGIKS